MTGPRKDWDRTYGGAFDDVAKSVVQTSDGGYALGGYTMSSGSGGADVWLVKADASGDLQWNKTYGGAQNDVASSVISTSDGGFLLIGYTLSFGAGSYDFWLVKTDASGNMQWNQTYGGAEDDVEKSAILTSDGGYALAGFTGSFGAGDFDFWLVKIDVSGKMEWNKTYGGAGDDEAYALVQTNDGGYALAGWTDSVGAGSWDAWLVKTDASGNMQWNKTYGGIGDDGALSMAYTSDGGYALGGYEQFLGAGGYDFWLFKTDGSGNVQWNQTYGGADDEQARTMVHASDGGYVLAGYTLSFGAGSWDAWLVKTDASGHMQWNQTYGGVDDDCAYFVAQTDDGGYASAGLTLSFGAGGWDAWLIKLAPQPVHNIDTGSSYNSIQEAIDAPETLNGQMIVCDAGSYTENVDVYKSLHVAGAGADAARVIPSTTGDCFHVNASNVIIEGFTIQSVEGYRGVFLDKTSQCCIENNTFTGEGGGILLDCSNESAILSNEVISLSGNGIELSSSSYNEISDNNVTSNSEGILLNSSSSNSISANNMMANGDCGIWLYYSSSNIISGNNVTGNSCGIWLDYSSSNSISGSNVAENGFGIVLWCSSNNLLTLNVMAGNIYNFWVPWVEGSGLSDFVNYVDTSNTVNGKPTYYWINRHDTTVPLDAGYVVLVNCTRIIARDLSLTSNGHGVRLAYTTNSTIIGNSITGNYRGIVLDSSSDNTISGNNITNGNRGISLVSSASDNSVFGNTIANNTYGIRLFNSSGNKIYHNSLIGNYVQVIYTPESDSMNVWDNGYPSGGNYWSDHNGIDMYSGIFQNESGCDGIGDASYFIDVNNTDNYPLMKPWPIRTAETTVKIAEENYTITVESNTTITYTVATSNTLGFTTSGPSGTTGYVSITIPMSLNVTEIKVFIDGVQFTLPTFPIITSNGTHYSIYFEFSQSSHNITMQYAIPGDINRDSVVDSTDLGILGAAWGSFIGDANYNANADLDNNGVVDSTDLGIMGVHWGEAG